MYLHKEFSILYDVQINHLNNAHMVHATKLKVTLQVYMLFAFSKNKIKKKSLKDHVNS